MYVPVSLILNLDHKRFFFNEKVFCNISPYRRCFPNFLPIISHMIKKENFLYKEGEITIFVMDGPINSWEHFSLRYIPKLLNMHIPA